jgi:hypothetical protein
VPNRKYLKGYNFERQLVNEWLSKGYYAKRMYGSKPFDFWVMGHGENYICEAKSWKRPPTERWLRKKYQWLKDMAERYNLTGALVYSKLGRGKQNYMRYML